MKKNKFRLLKPSGSPKQLRQAEQKRIRNAKADEERRKIWVGVTLKSGNKMFYKSTDRLVKCHGNPVPNNLAEIDANHNAGGTAATAAAAGGTTTNAAAAGITRNAGATNSPTAAEAGYIGPASPKSSSPSVARRRKYVPSGLTITTKNSKGSNNDNNSSVSPDAMSAAGPVYQNSNSSPMDRSPMNRSPLNSSRTNNKPGSNPTNDINLNPSGTTSPMDNGSGRSPRHGSGSPTNMGGVGGFPGSPNAAQDGEQRRLRLAGDVW